MEIQVAKNFEFLLDNFVFNQEEKQGFVFEGGSGSAKSYDIIQFLIYYCQINKSQGKDILIFRLTYADLKKTVLKDFIKILKMYNFYDINCHTKSHPQSYNMYGNMIYFTGLDGMGSHGERHDVIWGNEGMELEFEDWKQLNMRCNELFITDYNPSFTVHWIYESLIPRPDTKFLKSTQLDNPFLPVGQRQEIMAYEPYVPGSYEIVNNAMVYNGEPISDTNFPPPHPTNMDSGTADEFMWKVYGLGIRGAMKGVIFTNVRYIGKFPDMAYTYGLDFGFCVDKDTEILTKEGWKQHEALTTDDFTLTLNKETGQSEWQQIESVHRFTGNYEMWHIKGESHDSLTTPNHRWLIEKRPSSKIYNRKFKTTETIKHNDSISCAAKCSGLPTKKKYSDAFVELIAWFWTEGQITVGGISLWQNPGESADKMRACLKKVYGDQLIKTRNGRNRAKSGWVERPLHKDRCCHFAINLNGSERLLDVAPNKVVSSQFINDLTYKQLILFIDISIEADGWLNKTGTRYITQSKKARLDPIMIMCSLVGIRTSLGGFDSRGFPQWRLTLFKNNSSLVIGELIHRRDKLNKIIYSGLIWCPKTENQTWLARRNGKTYFTGNTVDPTALVRYAEDATDIYLELLSYAPMDSPYIIHDYMEAIGIEKDVPITADSSDKHTNDRGSYEMVSELFAMEWEISKVSKTGSVMMHIGTMKRKRINIVKNAFYHDFKKEQENYRLKEINGIAINQPMDKFNHAWDASRYAKMAHDFNMLESDWG